jgi:hypothetical protein
MFGIKTRLKKMMRERATDGFTNGWFDGAAKDTWDQLIPQLDPIRILEIGSYEGASATYLINSLAHRHDIELHCIDIWDAGIQYSRGLMNRVEERFDNNVARAISRAPFKVEFHKHIGPSDDELSKMLAEGKRGYFDFIYVDGSHLAPDVLFDAVMSFRLLRVGGIIAFDDYLWSENLPGGVDPIRCPKPAIDSFTTLYSRKISILSAPLYQLYVEKTAE